MSKASTFGQAIIITYEHECILSALTKNFTSAHISTDHVAPMLFTSGCRLKVRIKLAWNLSNGFPAIIVRVYIVFGRLEDYLHIIIVVEYFKIAVN